MDKKAKISIYSAIILVILLIIFLPLIDTGEGDYTGVHFDTAASGNTNPRGMTQNGTFFWITDDPDSGPSKVYKYYMNGTYTGEVFNLSMVDINSQRVDITNNNIFFWMTVYNGSAGGNTGVYKFYMNGTYIERSFIAEGGVSSNQYGITQNNTFFWTTNMADAEVYQYYMNGTYTGFHFDTSISGNAYPVSITQNNIYFWIVDFFEDKVYRYWMNGTYTPPPFDVSAAVNGITQNGIFFWVTDRVDAEVYQYKMINLCYQETANVSTECGGLNSGSYNIEGDWVNPSKVYDEDWDTYGQTTIGGNGYIYINYTKPVGGILNSMIKLKVNNNFTDTLSYNFNVKYPENFDKSTGEGNITIPMKCWEQSVLQFRISSLMTDPSPKGIYGGGLAFSCYNGTKWIGLVIEECIYNNETILPSDEKCSRFYEEAMIWNIDDNPPISVASATSPPDGAEYSFDTWIANNVKVTISTSDAGVGYDSSSFPVYCTDTTDTCEPSIFINSGVNISTEGISYIRYYSNDTVGNKEETKSKIIKIDTTGPNVTINSPLNISYNTGIINFNVTTNDLFNYIGNCSYSLNDGVTNYSINTSYCYQETANVSTECGGLATGSYNITENLTNPLNIYDGDWNTYSDLSEVGYGDAYINYTKSLGSISNSIWQIKGNTDFNDTLSYETVPTIDGNITIPLKCWNQDVLQFKINSFLSGPIFLDVYLSEVVFNCYDGINWIELAYVGCFADGVSNARKCTRVYEEAMFWNYGNYTAINSTMTEGEYTARFYCNDSLNNLNFTETVSFIVDITNPLILITHPTNNTNHSNNQLNINYTVSDVNLDSCWYSNDTYSVNTSLGTGGSCSNITTVVWDEGQHDVTIWVNDTANNINSSRVYFFIDAISPNIEITYPPNNTNTTDTQLDINYTVSDTNLDSCWWSEDNGASNNSIECDVNITTETWSEELNTIIIYVNDTSGNENSSSVTFFVDTIPPVSTATMKSPPDGVLYTNNTWTKNNVEVTMIGDDGAGVGFDNLVYPKYCVDTTNTCTPSTCIGSGTTISTEGVSYIRYYSNDTLGNVETTKSQTIKIDTITPSVNISYPTAALNLSYNTNIPLNFSVSDSSSSLDKCWYKIDSGSNTTISCLTNNTFSTSEGNHVLYFFANDTVGNLNNSRTVSFTVDLSNPVIIVNSPLNNTNSSTATINFNSTVSDNLALKNVSLYLDGILNQTNSSELNNSNYIFTNILSEGTHTWLYNTCDWTNNCVNSSLRNILIDTLVPNVSYDSTTNLNASYTQNSWILVNISASDTNLHSVRLNWNGTNETFANNVGNNYWSNKSGLSNGIYTFYGWANDSAGSYNLTSTRTVTVDVINPVVNIQQPTSSTYNYNEGLPLNFTAIDTNRDTCWYNLDEGSNITLSSCANITFDTTETTHTIYVYANDSSGRIGSDSVFFAINLAPPSVSLEVPINNKWLNYSTIQFNYTASDTQLSTCSLYSNFTGIWALNITNSTPNNGITSTFTRTISDGVYIWNIACNDTGGNSVFGGLTNRTLYVDTVVPLISYTTGTESNNTNTTNNYIFVNVSIIEDKFASVTFRLFNSIGSYNITTYSDSTREINWTNLPDDVYFYNVTVLDNANNSNTTELRIRTLDDTPPIITIQNPLAQNYANNDSMTLNYTVTDNVIGISECWYYIKFTNGTIIKSTENLYSCENDTFTLPGGDNDFKLSLFAKDLLDNIDVKEVTFGIRTESPAISLVPGNDTHNNYINNHIFNFTVSTNADSISTCELWINSTGTWHKNQTIITVYTSPTVNSFSSINLSEDKYDWNIWCNDSLNNAGWGLNNQSYIIDITTPDINISSISTTQGVQTFWFNTSVSDNYLSTTTCKYSIYNSTNNIDGFNVNVPFTCNSLESATATSYGTFTLKTYTTDKATNQNSTNSSFTLSPSVPGSGGGGSSTPIIIISEGNWTMTTEGGGERYQLNMLQGTVRTKDIVFQNLGEEEKTITLECEKFSGPTNLCDIIEFKTKTFTLEKLKDIKQSVSFAINIPEDYEKSDYVVNIFAADENGITKSITTEVNVETFGILTKGVIKLGSYKKIGNLVFPYILIFLIIFVSLSMLFSFLLKKAKVPGNVGFGIVLALFVSLLITLFI